MPKKFGNSVFFRNFVPERTNQPKMKSRLSHILLLLVAFAIVFGKANAQGAPDGLQAQSAEVKALGFNHEKPLCFGIDQDYPPLQYLDQQQQPQGFDVEFTRRLMLHLGIPMDFKPNTWTNIADDILKNRVDLGMMVYSTYRKNDAYFSRAVFRLYYQMVTRKTDKRMYGLRDIEGKTFILMRSRPVIDTLEASGAKVVITTDLSKSMHELSEGKYDALICFRYQARYLLATEHLTNLVANDLALMPREYCYVSQNKALIDVINKALDEVEAKGIIDEVYANVKSDFGDKGIPSWVWYLLGGIIIVALFIFNLQLSRSRTRLKKEINRSRENEIRALKSEEEARRNAEEARESAELARKTEELKGIFLSNVSHALRTPLNAIIGFSDLLLTDQNDDIPADERRNLMGLINENGLQLLHLINELLNLSDIEGKEKFFNMEVTDIVAEFDKYVAEIRPQLHPGVELVVNEPVGGIRAMVDRRFMRMVNMHLLENAVQHTTEGKITLSYYVKQGGIYAEVRDTGDGLPPQLKENIFALLNDKNTYLQDETPGLGLSICKAICDKMGGQIGARDNDIDGRGTIIWTWAEVELV